MRGQMAREQPRIDVIARADADADHEPHRLASEEGGDVLLRDGGRGESYEQSQQDLLHDVIQRGGARR
jgi:hypothetical protein